MDFVKPLSSIIPGTTGRILEVLGRTSRPLNLSTLADLAGVSLAQASRVLPRLVSTGLVTRQEFPPSSLFALNRDHVSAPAILALLRAPEEVQKKLKWYSSRIKPTPVNVTMFGSAANGMATAESDIDVLVVRPHGVEPSDEQWTWTLADWAELVHKAVGNPVSILEVEEREVPKLVRSGRAPWKDIVLTGVTIFGRDLAAIQDPR